ncbi:hypothetical protein GLAREA_06366 [Glarea lozoyensis ATCC 20868]|uniref:Uncharacterized protein n=1 Tax=Glarea lozoyensis (strain ATCC 20868 / MF5171) TaxID=1116229 RepID=S3D8A9_GLAL2|nr:uncharacterized protein GLAREA_06366 [Glarea lozoyensis ATCC 20868]EPE33354.1 hypothetical protein GLAREA_06366 [Glarea lozoyensis ATCC 20868]
MCQWEAVEVESSQCEQIPLNEPAHRYQIRSFHLCRDATNSTTEGWQLCNNVTGRDGQEYADMGSRRTTPCPVCRELNKAEEDYRVAYGNAVADYEMASQVALTKYNTAVAIADDDKRKRIENSAYQNRYFPRRRH